MYVMMSNMMMSNFKQFFTRSGQERHSQEGDEIDLLMIYLLNVTHTLRLASHWFNQPERSNPIYFWLFLSHNSQLYSQIHTHSQNTNNKIRMMLNDKTEKNKNNIKRKRWTRTSWERLLCKRNGNRLKGGNPSYYCLKNCRFIGSNNIRTNGITMTDVLYMIIFLKARSITQRNE